MVISKDNSLADGVTTIYLQAIIHQIYNHLVNGVLIEDIAKQLIVLNIAFVQFVIRNVQLCLFIFPDALHLLFLLLRQLIILDTVLQDICGTRQYNLIYQITIINSLIKQIFEIRLSTFTLKQLIRASIIILSRCGGQSYHQRIEIT